MTLNQLLRLPEKIPNDKRLHFMIGVVYTSILVMFTLNLWIILTTLIALAWGIEVFQKITKSGNYDNLDALAVVIGGLFPLLHIIGEKI